MMKNVEKDFKQYLAKFEDKEEWEVKIYVDLIRMMDWIFETSPGTKENELVQDELNKKIKEYKQKSFGWMKKQAQEAKLNKILPKESNQRKKDMVLNSIYLISKEDRENFTMVVRLLEKEYKSKGLEFECTGSKPPYNFLAVK